MASTYRHGATPMSMGSECPGLEALRALAIGQLDETRVSEVQAHLTVCPTCSETSRALEEWAGGEETGAFEDAEVDGENTLGGGSATVLADSDDMLSVGELDLSFLAPTVCYRSIGRIGLYEVVSLLGRGGMGLVFKGLDQSLGRPVAVKVLAPRLASSSRARRRFLREARAAAAINHPSVVTIHGVGVHRGLPFLVMEYIAGRSLRQRIKKDPHLRLVEVLRIVSQVLDGLTAAHEHGVIHRDINPANIMLEGELERVKITDFGLARVAAGVSGLTSVDQVIGTPAFMAPEQVMGEPVDARSDLFSLGCVIYAMVTGQSPFKGGHPLDIVRRVREWDPPPLSEVAPECPSELSALVGRLMAKAPSDRFSSASEVANALRPLLVQANLADSAEGFPAVPREVPRADPPKIASEAETTPPFEPPAGPLPPASRPVSPALRPWNRPQVRLTAVSVLAIGLLGLSPWAWKTGEAWWKSGPRKPVVWRVGRTAPGASPSLASAIQKAGPGDLVRIVDDETYDGQVWLDDAQRWSGLTIEAAPGASPTLVASNGASVVTVRDVPGVLIRGLAIRARPDQTAVRLEGWVEGVTLESLRSEKSPGSTRAHVHIGPGSHGSTARPISVRQCRFSGGDLGVVVEGGPRQPVSFLVVEANGFRNLDNIHLTLKGHLVDVSVAGNRFCGGGEGILVDVPPYRAERLTIDRNSLIGVRRWLDPGGSDGEQNGIVISRNAVFEPSTAIDPVLDREYDRRLTAMARLGWRFEANLVEAARGADPSEGPLYRSVDQLPVISRDPSDPHFLRPSPGSLLAGDEPGAYVGALPPLMD